MNIYLTRLIFLVSIILTSLLISASTYIFDKSEPYIIFAENDILKP